jgi:hypothetical protein
LGISIPVLTDGENALRGKYEHGFYFWYLQNNMEVKKRKLIAKSVI